MLFDWHSVAIKNETRCRSGVQKMVALAGQFPNRFFVDLKQLVSLKI
jgi:hypothetical protein